MIDQKRQPPLKQVMLTGLLTVSLAGFSASVFAAPPAQECPDGTVYYAKYEVDGGWENPPGSEGLELDPVPSENENSGTWTSTSGTEIAAIIVKAGNDPIQVTEYDPPVTSGSYSYPSPPAISHITFCVKDGVVPPQNKGVCVLNYDTLAPQSGLVPRILNQLGPWEVPERDGDPIWRGDPPAPTVPDPWTMEPIARFLSCYQTRFLDETLVTGERCRVMVGMEFPKHGVLARVLDAYWFPWAVNCKELIDGGYLPGNVKLLATGVNLTAKLIGNNDQVKLKLTTTAEPDTAKLLILRGINHDNGGTEIEIACDGKEFDSGSSQYTCIDTPAADSYRAAEKEYDGSFIVYDEVTPE